MMIPPEAAAQLRRLAQQGSSSLRELGILSVQLEGDQVSSIFYALITVKNTMTSLTQTVTHLMFCFVYFYLGDFAYPRWK
jgi:hypothetical protein